MQRAAVDVLPAVDELNENVADLAVLQRRRLQPNDAEVVGYLPVLTTLNGTVSRRATRFGFTTMRLSVIGTETLISGSTPVVPGVAVRALPTTPRTRAARAAPTNAALVACDLAPPS